MTDDPDGSFAAHADEGESEFRYEPAERVESDHPECPHCRTVHETNDDFCWLRINCECGYAFIAEKKVVVVSTPLEYRE